MKKLNRKALPTSAGRRILIAGLVLASAGISQAQIDGTVTGETWLNQANAGTAFLGNQPTTTPDATFTTTALNYNPLSIGENGGNASLAPFTFNSFLQVSTLTTWTGTPSSAFIANDNTSPGTGVRGSGSLDPTVPNTGTTGTMMYFTGEIHLNAGANTFVISHDDGYGLNVTGSTSGGPVGTTPPGDVTFINGGGEYTASGYNSPGGSDGNVDTFVLDATTSGDYPFQLVYGECCSPPAELIMDVNGETSITGSGVPDSATTMGLLGVSLSALGVFARRIKK